MWKEVFGFIFALENNSSIHREEQITVYDDDCQRPVKADELKGRRVPTENHKHKDIVDEEWGVDIK